MTTEGVFAVRLEQAPSGACNFPYEIVTEVPPLSDSTELVTITPKRLLLRFTPKKGEWELTLVMVDGPSTTDGDSDCHVHFLHPLEADEPQPMPEWLTEIARYHQHLLNPGMLEERQQEAARKAAREMFSLASEDLADEMADTIFTAIRRVG